MFLVMLQTGSGIRFRVRGRQSGTYSAEVGKFSQALPMEFLIRLINGINWALNGIRYIEILDWYPFE